ncbi:MAG: flavin monoamine oxidase family protein [Alphaproteobacteria bacterium]
MPAWTTRIANDAAPASRPSVAVIGAGVAGLTAAYKLSKKGFAVTVYEASQRIGGRIYTDYDAFKEQGQFCEKGGEWIDSTHHAVHELAHELGLEIQDISKKRTGEDLFYFNGIFHPPSDFLNYDRQTGQTTGDYFHLAKYIGKDRKKARLNHAYARQLDDMSVEAYLDKAARETQTPSWVIQALKVAYKGEFGAEPSEQSSLLLINQIGVGMKRPFEVYGPKQDESQRIKGGNHALIEALKNAIESNGGRILTGHKLTAIDQRTATGEDILLTFSAKESGRPIRIRSNYAVCTLPFSKLREVEGLADLKERGRIGEEKYNAIQSLGYGNIVKIMLGMHGHPLEDNPAIPFTANGSFRSDNPYLQNTWITSVGQKGEQDSILTVLVAGNEAKQPPGTIVRNCKKAFAALAGKKEDDIFNHRHSVQVWPRHEFSKGSYAYFKTGQYTTLRNVAGTPEIGGRLGFAGEHTDPLLYGYMCGAIASACHEADRITQQEKSLNGTADHKIPKAARG